MNWQEAQEWERNWHGDCANSFYEESKQLGYAKRMGLTMTRDDKTPYNLDLKGASVLDIGGGPVSLLLKSVNGGNLVVADPCNYPEWVKSRYEDHGIQCERTRGEDLDTGGFDEAWIYNCLQHTEDFHAVLANARRAAKIIRIFEWIDFPISAGHNHILRAAELDDLLGGQGKTEMLDGTGGLSGKAYFGIFKGDS